MVHSCAAINCTARWKKGVETKFHRIPIKDNNIRKAWLHALRRVNYDPKYGFVCEKHFIGKSDYEINVHGNKVLKKGAVPSVFNFPSYYKNTIKGRGSLKIEETVQGQLKKCENEASNTSDTSDETVVPIEVYSEKSVEQSPVINVLAQENVDKNNMEIALKSSSEQIHSTLNQNSQSVRRRRDPIYFGDFEELDMNDEEKRKRFWKVSHQTILKHKKLTKFYQCKLRRQTTKIKNLNASLEELQTQQKIPHTQLLVLQTRAESPTKLDQHLKTSSNSQIGYKVPDNNQASTSAQSDSQQGGSDVDDVTLLNRIKTEEDAFDDNFEAGYEDLQVTKEELMDIVNQSPQDSNAKESAENVLVKHEPHSSEQEDHSEPPNKQMRMDNDGKPGPSDEQPGYGLVCSSQLATDQDNSLVEKNQQDPAIAGILNNTENLKLFFQSVLALAETFGPLDQVLLQRNVANVVFGMKIAQLTKK